MTWEKLPLKDRSCLATLLASSLVRILIAVFFVVQEQLESAWDHPHLSVRFFRIQLKKKVRYQVVSISSLDVLSRYLTLRYMLWLASNIGRSARMAPTNVNNVNEADLVPGKISFCFLSDEAARKYKFVTYSLLCIMTSTLLRGNRVARWTLLPPMLPPLQHTLTPAYSAVSETINDNKSIVSSIQIRYTLAEDFLDGD